MHFENVLYITSEAELKTAKTSLAGLALIIIIIIIIMIIQYLYSAISIAIQ